MFVLLAVAAALGAYVLLKKSTESPFEHLPLGLTSANVASTGPLQGMSGRRYDTYSWAPDSDGRSFHVAKDTATGAWISWWAAAPTGTRTLYLVHSPERDGSSADVAEVAALRKDFGA